MNFIQSMIFLYLVSVNNDHDPELTTAPDIQYNFESLHAIPFWFLAILKPTTPFISIFLCTTNSTLHLLSFMESTVPAFKPPLWTFSVIYFLSSVSSVGRNDDLSLKNHGSVVYLYHVQLFLW